MSIIDMRICFDFEKSVEDLRKLKEQVAKMDVEYFEEAANAEHNIWEYAFHLNLFALVLHVSDAGRVKDDGRVNLREKENPEIQKINGKLLELFTEVGALLEDIKEDVDRNSGCFGGGSVLLCEPWAEKRRKKLVDQLQRCFAED